MTDQVAPKGDIQNDTASSDPTQTPPETDGPANESPGKDESRSEDVEKKSITEDHPRNEEADDASDEAEDDEDDEEEEEESEEDEEEEDEEPQLKYARLTQHLGGLYRNGDATSTFLVAGDKMVRTKLPRAYRKNADQFSDRGLS